MYNTNRFSVKEAKHLLRSTGCAVKVAEAPQERSVRVMRHVPRHLIKVEREQKNVCFHLKADEFASRDIVL